jgi:hypothetical protein
LPRICNRVHLDRLLDTHNCVWLAYDFLLIWLILAVKPNEP